MLLKNLKSIIAGTFLLAIISATSSYAQNEYLNCGTSQAVQKVLDANPKLKQEYLAEQARLEQIDREAFVNGYKENESKQTQATIYTIPIVFHVLHENGTENISDAQIYDEVRILNEDYRKLNADISAVVPSFTSVAADCEIQFRLAQKDPNGNCTNGIDRIYSSLTNSADDNSKLNTWATDKYLNVWAVKTIGTAGVAGYAYYPGMAWPASTDGVLILSQYIGSIGTGSVSTSRALTHEIGHYLNLQHTWGNTNDPAVACGNDGVTDTPLTKGHTSCVLSDAVCTSGVVENVQNYMEYAYCSKMFTAGQKTRMRSALTSSTGSRNNLWTTTNLTATGISTPAVLCKADFGNSTNNNIVCSGDSVKFTDMSWNGTPTGWNWTFPGGTPSSSIDSMPIIYYNTPGIYNVSLTVSNTSGSVSATKTSYITVNNSTALYNAAVYSEGFEGAAIPNTDWVVRNPDSGSNAWVQTSAAASLGTKSVRIVNSSSSVGQIDELISPPINMTGITGSSPTLNFKVAYAQTTSTSNDKLALYVSTNCGKNWQLRKSLTGLGTSSNALTTGGVVTSSFVPNASQWSQKSLVLTSFASQPSLYIMFRFTSDGGNNVYIDDVNLSGTASAGMDELANSIYFNIYPNPIEENSIITFNLIEKQKVDVKIFDVLGREVSNLYSGELNAGEHQYAVSEKSSLVAGVYFVQLNVGSHSFTKKLIVK